MFSFKKADWIRKSGIELEDKYICSRCRTESATPEPRCAGCNSKMKNVIFSPNWYLEAEMTGQYAETEKE